ncbi:YhdP family protein [Oceanobacter mangrovi]|uniref:YhdP family protein n=1 Tax=Oceanobacter mangrovi TaxID=2862510 RepID=UPI001C8F02EC|nr:YhdP family protein [Oceanobacter mangrovi]
MRFLTACWTQIWITLVVGLVLTALYTSLGRQLIPLVETWRPELEQTLSQQLGQPVAIERLEGDWRYLSPIVRAINIRVGDADHPISLQRLELELDVSATAFYRMPVFKRIELEGLNARLSRDAEQQWFSGNWLLNPPTATTTTVEEPDKNREKRSSAESADANRPRWARLLELQQRMEVLNGLVEVTNPDGKVDRLRIDQLLWRHQGNSQSVRGSIAWGRKQLANISLNAVVTGNVWPWKDQHGEVFAYVEPQSWTRWIPDDLPMGLQFKQFDAGASLWLTVTNGQLDKVYADLSLDQLRLQTSEQPLELDSGRIQIGGERNGDDWHMRIRPQLGDKVALDDFSVSLVQLDGQRGWQLGIDQLAVGEGINYMTEHGLLPDPFDRYFANINPAGEASQVRVSFLPGDDSLVDVRAHVHNVAGSAYMGIPGIQGLDGELHLQPHRGRLSFDDKNVTLDLAGVYDHPWDMNSVSGQLYWQIEQDASKLWLTNLKGRWNHLQLRSELSLLLPSRASGRPQELSLLLGMPKASVEDRSRLLPDLLEPEVRNWIDSALISGELANGAFLLNGELEVDRPANSLTTQLALDIDEGELEYMPDWPIVYGVKGHMLLDSPSVDAWLEQGRTLGGRLVKNSGRVRLRNPPGQPTELSLAGKISGDSREAIRYFHDTPLQQLVNHAFDEWHASGPMTASMQMQMQLGSDVAPPKVHLEADLKDNRLALNDLNLDFSQINGPLVYDTQAGIASPAISASVMGGQVSGTIASTPVPEQADAFRIRVQAEGEADVEAFKQWMPLFLLDPVTGRADYQADLKLDTSNSKLVFALDSNLKGTSINYPAPLQKAADDASHRLQVEVRPGRETRVTLNYDDQIRGVFALDDKGLERGQVYMGGSQPFLPSDHGVEIRGDIREPIKADEWWAMWQHLLPLAEAENKTAAASTAAPATNSSTTAAATTASQTATAENPLRLIELRFSAIDAWTVPTGPMRLTATQQWGEWNFDIDSDLLRGQVTLPSDDQPAKMALEYVHMPPSEAEDPLASSATQQVTGEDAVAAALKRALEQDSLKDMEPAELLPMDVVIKEFMLGGWNFGSWNVSSRPIDKGAAITINDGSVKGLKLSGDMRWLKNPDGHKTWIDMLRVDGRDIGKVQQAFRQDAIIEGKRMKSSVSLNWQGSPMAFNTQSLNGLASIRIEDGTWKTEGAGALKAFGALNFNSISRRLQLDFSDLYQSGVAFDVTTAKAKIENGLFTFTDPLVVDGPGAKFMASGSTNLNTEALDMKLAVTFPVTGSLPIVAVLAGFAAPVAGAIYVTEKLIGDELERFTSASYDITGNWTKPQMKIREAFDNEVEGKRVRSFKERFLSIFGLEESK